MIAKESSPRRVRPMADRKAGKFGAAQAREVADEIIAMLAPACHLIEIAGSLRRRRSEVGDIEIVFVPNYKLTESTSDLFPEPYEQNQAELQIEALLEMRLIDKRPNVKGTTSWGLTNKLAVHVESGIPVDLFTANSQNFYNYLVCRTGPSESNIRICNAAIAKGWKWNPYGSGFSRNDDVHVCASERDVFDFVGLPYREPWER